MDVVVAAGGAAWEQAALGEIERSATLRLARRCVDVEDLLSVAHTGRASAAIVSTGLVGLDLDAVTQLEQAGMQVATLEAEHSRGDLLGIRRVLRLGALDELGHAPFESGAVTAGRRAATVAVWGPAGAPGRSTVALALASAAAHRVDTVLVDADTHGGSLGQMLGVLDDVSGLVAACRAANNGRAHEVEGLLIAIDPGLRLLTGLPRADMWPQVRTSAWEAVVSRLVDLSQLVVIDCGSSIETGQGVGAGNRHQTTIHAVQHADVVVVVGRPDPVGLSRLVRGVHDLVAVAPGREVVIAVNMMRTSLGWGEREVHATVARLTGMEPTVHLPFDQAALDLAVLRGVSPRQAVPSSPFVARIEVLASHLLTSVLPADVLAASRR